MKPTWDSASYDFVGDKGPAEIDFEAGFLLFSLSMRVSSIVVLFVEYGRLILVFK